MKTAQLDLFTEKPTVAAWPAGESRGLSGRIGYAQISIRVQRTNDGFKWQAQFLGPAFGTSIPWSPVARRTPDEAFGEASACLRQWLTKKSDHHWSDRFDRWVKQTSASELTAHADD